MQPLCGFLVFQLQRQRRVHELDAPRDVGYLGQTGARASRDSRCFQIPVKPRRLHAGPLARSSGAAERTAGRAPIIIGCHGGPVQAPYEAMVTCAGAGWAHACRRDRRAAPAEREATA